MEDNNELPSFSSLTGCNIHVKIIDIGASPIDGDPPYARMMRRGDAEVVGFEPNPSGLALLNKGKGENESYLPHAIGDGGVHTLHLCRAPGLTSFFRPNPAVLNLFDGFSKWGQVVGTSEVQSVRLDEIEEARSAVYLKIDIEGAELMALRHARETLRDVLVIQSEVVFLPLFLGQPLFAELETFLREQGFMLYRFYHLDCPAIRTRSPSNRIAESHGLLLAADAVFLRDITKLESLSCNQLLNMAAILHDCYGAVDLCLHLICERDRRVDGQMARCYLTALRSALG